jgi:hypothetical protein
MANRFEAAGNRRHTSHGRRFPAEFDPRRAKNMPRVTAPIDAHLAYATARWTHQSTQHVLLFADSTRAHFRCCSRQWMAK